MEVLESSSGLTIGSTLLTLGERIALIYEDAIESGDAAVMLEQLELGIYP
jgi:hypothetical protein